MGRSCKGLTNYLDIRTKSPDKKQKEIFGIIDITIQYFSNLLKKISKSPYLGYRSKQVHNEPTKA